MAEPRFVIAQVHIRMVGSTDPPSTYIKVFEQDASLLDVVKWADSKADDSCYETADIDIRLESD
uniref:Uncharacterized protein n=1 Tax=viral metagenome TaxID=1070528 RepID=A0A6M3XSS8_9ZZZZ